MNFCANYKFVIPKENMLIKVIFLELMSSKLAQNFKRIRNPQKLDRYFLLLMFGLKLGAYQRKEREIQI